MAKARLKFLRSMERLRSLPAKRNILILGAVFAVLALGTALRLYRLDDQSLWGDEALSLTMARLSLSQISDELTRNATNTFPPLYFYTLHGWLNVFGFGPLQARLLSAVCGTLAILTTFLLAKYVFDRRVGLVAALLVAISQLNVMYSQEARPYSPVLFLVGFSTYLFAIALREKRARAWWCFVLTCALMLLTHYYAVFVVGCFILYLLRYGRLFELPRSWFLGGGLAMMLSFLPWMSFFYVQQFLREGTHVQKMIFKAQPSYFAVSKWTPVTTINFFNNGRVIGLLDDGPPWTWLVGGVLFTAPVMLAFASLVWPSKLEPDCFHKRGTILLGILWLVPTAIVIFIGYALNFPYDVRYVSFCTLPYYILVGRGILLLPGLMLPGSIVLMLVAYSTFSLRSNYFIPYKENYRDALRHVVSHYQESDCIISSPFGKGLPAQWFLYQYDKIRPSVRVTDVESVMSHRIHCDRLWFVAYRRVTVAIRLNEAAEQDLERSYRRVEETKFFWVHVSVFEPKPPGS
jgi:mannosyltransferase